MQQEEQRRNGPLGPLAALRKILPFEAAATSDWLIMRRVEHAWQLLRATDLSLAEVALHAGFSGQSQFSHHFKRIVGVTPRQFRMSARIA
jgi:AraC-like DNA-binding protein